MRASRLLSIGSFVCLFLFLTTSAPTLHARGGMQQGGSVVDLEQLSFGLCIEKYPKFECDSRRGTAFIDVSGYSEFVVFPDGKGYAMVNSRHTSRIQVFRSDGTKLREFEPPYSKRESWRQHVRQLVISPDGQTILFTSNRDNQDDQIFSIRTDGTAFRKLTTDGINSSPSFTSDGKKVVFITNRKGSGHTAQYVMNPDGADQMPLSEYAPHQPPTLTAIPDLDDALHETSFGGVVIGPDSRAAAEHGCGLGLRMADLNTLLCVGQDGQLSVFDKQRRQTRILQSRCLVPTSTPDKNPFLCYDTKNRLSLLDPVKDTLSTIHFKGKELRLRSRVIVVPIDFGWPQTVTN